jgi:hypothetical protein
MPAMHPQQAGNFVTNLLIEGGSGIPRRSGVIAHGLWLAWIDTLFARAPQSQPDQIQMKRKVRKNGCKSAVL